MYYLPRKSYYKVTNFYNYPAILSDRCDLSNTKNFYCLIPIMLLIQACTDPQQVAKNENAYKISILNINSFDIIIPDISLHSRDLMLIKTVINDLKYRLFINKSGKNLQMKITAVEFKKPTDKDGVLPYFIKLEFSGRTHIEEFTITGTYKIDDTKPETYANAIKQIAYHISRKIIIYLNQNYGFKYDDAFDDVFINYNSKNSNASNIVTGAGSSGINVIWESLK